MITGVQYGSIISIDDLYKVMQRESERALQSAQHGLADADFQRRAKMPACFPETEHAPERRRDAAGRTRRAYL
jgi:hypothetical protein